MASLRSAREYWALFSSRFGRRPDRGPINDESALSRFVSTRAAFIAQKTLYGYVKARMGIGYPEMFRDDAIIRSVNIAKMHYFAACLSDLAVHAVARATAGTADDRTRRDMADRIYAGALAANMAQSVPEFSDDDAIRDFRTRLSAVDWNGLAQTRDVFALSPKALIRWAPIADNLKTLDAEYAENSVRFAWAEVRRDFEKRLDPSGFGGVAP